MASTHPSTSLRYADLGDGILVGSYPQTVEDLQFLVREHAVRSVLSLQSDADLKQRAVASEPLWFAGMQMGLAMVRVPITDFDTSDLLAKLGDAVETLRELHRDCAPVYVHCTAGLNRSPTVVVAYLADRDRCSPEAAGARLLSAHSCVPYIDVVAAWLARNSSPAR